MMNKASKTADRAEQELIRIKIQRRFGRIITIRYSLIVN